MDCNQCLIVSWLHFLQGFEHLIYHSYLYLKAASVGKDLFFFILDSLVKRNSHIYTDKMKIK